MNDFAIDYNGDGRVDLMDPDDAIGCVANFLSQHGWVKDGQIAIKAKARVKGTFVSRNLPGPEPTIWLKQENFKVLRQYNPSDSYAIAILILSVKVKDAKEAIIEAPGATEVLPELEYDPQLYQSLH